MELSRSCHDVPFIPVATAATLLFWREWLELLCYLRHQKECACASIPIGENRIYKFQSVLGIRGKVFATPVNVTKMRPLFEG